MWDFGICNGACIESGVVSSIFLAHAFVWALGFGVGKAVAWTRNLSNVA